MVAMQKCLIEILLDEENELIDQIIDIFNDFLLSKNLTYDNAERTLYQFSDLVIYGENDLIYLHNALNQLLKKWNIFPSLPCTDDKIKGA